MMATTSGDDIQALREGNAMLIKLVGRLRRELRTDQMLHSFLNADPDLSHGPALADDDQARGSLYSSSIACSGPISYTAFSGETPLFSTLLESHGNTMRNSRDLPHNRPASVPQPGSEAQSIIMPSTLNLTSVGNQAVSDIGRPLLDGKAKKRMRKVGNIAQSSDGQPVVFFPFPGTLPPSISQSDTPDTKSVHTNMPSATDDTSDNKSVHTNMPSTTDDDNIVTAPTFSVEELPKVVNPIECHHKSFHLPTSANSDCREMVMNVLGAGLVVDPHLVATEDHEDDVDAVPQDRITKGAVVSEANITLINSCGTKNRDSCHGDVCAEVVSELAGDDEAGAVAENEVKGSDVDRIDIDFGEADQKAIIGDQEGESYTQGDIGGTQRLDGLFVDGIELLDIVANPDKAAGCIDVGVGREAEAVGSKVDQGIVRSEDVMGSCTRHCKGQGGDGEEEEEAVRNVAHVQLDEVQDEAVRAKNELSTERDQKGWKLRRTYLWMLTGAVAIGAGSLFYASRKWPLKP